MKKAQAILEFTLIFIITATLLAGLLGLWKWSSDNIVKRQLAYNTSRLEAGSRAATPSFPGIPPAVTAMLSEAQAFLDALKGKGGSFSGLSLDEINANLESINQAIADIQDGLAALTAYQNKWKNSLEDSRQKEAESQQSVNALEAELAQVEEKRRDALARGVAYDEYGQPILQNYDAEINRLNQEISKAKNGYYTLTVLSCSSDGTCANVTTYDDSNTQWMARFETREKWAEDYSNYQQYGVSLGNNVYGLYANYTPGLLDWQARATYTQEQYNQGQPSLESAQSVLSQITAVRDQLQQAKDQKT